MAGLRILAPAAYSWRPLGVASLVRGDLARRGNPSFDVVLRKTVDRLTLAVAAALLAAGTVACGGGDDSDAQDAPSGLSEVEKRWLDYAWRVVACPLDHKRICEANGGAMPGEGRVEGNELRWPGYLGRHYREELGVLCVGAVHREATPELLRRQPTVGRTDAELIAASRAWAAEGRSDANDAAYLRRLRAAYEIALPEWGRWRRHFKTLVEDYLALELTQIAWTNLAKCRVSIDRGASQRAAEAKLTRLCQRRYPVAEVVEAVRPAVVLVAVLGARAGGDIVSSWRSMSCAPLVFAWQGQSGHDRHNTAPGARRLSEWAPEMVEQVQRRIQSRERGLG